MKHYKKMLDQSYTIMLGAVFKKILEVALNKPVAIRPLTFHLINHPMQRTAGEVRTNSEAIFSYELLHWVPSRRFTERDG